MPRTPVIPTGSAPPLAPYSPGSRAGNTVYVSGMLALDAEGILVGEGGVRAQTRHVIEAIKAVGGSLDDVAHNAIFLKDLVDYAAMNEVYGQYFGTNSPTRDCIEANLVRPTFLVEISATANLD